MTSSSRSAVIVISQLPPPVHGSTVMTQTFMEILQSLGRRTCLVDRRFSTSVEEIGTASVRKVLAAFSLVGRLCRALLRNPRAEVVFFTTNRSPSFWVDVMMACILGVLRRPYIAYVHTSGYAVLATRGGFHRRGVVQLLSRARSVVVLGESMRADIEPFSKSVSIIANAVPASDHDAKRADAAPSLAFVSNLIPGKGAEDFMRIAARCLSEVPEARAIVVGRSSEEGYVDELRSMLPSEVVDRVRFAGALYDRERDEAIAPASILVFPSTYRYEAQPLSVLEAMNLGIPAVAYDVGGLRDVIDDDVNGYLVPESDWNSAADRCLAVLSSPRLRSRLSWGALSAAADKHGLARYRDAWCRLLKEAD